MAGPNGANTDGANTHNSSRSCVHDFSYVVDVTYLNGSKRPFMPTQNPKAVTTGHVAAVFAKGSAYAKSFHTSPPAAKAGNRVPAGRASCSGSPMASAEMVCL